MCFCQRLYKAFISSIDVGLVYARFMNFKEVLNLSACSVPQPAQEPGPLPSAAVQLQLFGYYP